MAISQILFFVAAYQLARLANILNYTPWHVVEPSDYFRAGVGRLDDGFERIAKVACVGLDTGTVQQAE
jgi:hypothetical protein